MKQKYQNKKIDFVVTCFLLLITALIHYFLNLPAIVGWFFYLGIPSSYLMWREKKNYKKIAFALLLFGVIFAFIFDFIVTLNEGWVVTRLAVPFRLFGFYPFFDDILGFVLMTLFIVVFYEHFFDDEKNKRISNRFIQGLIPSLVVLTLVLAVYWINSEVLKLSYVYTVSGVAAIILPLYVGFKRPQMLNKLLGVSFFFFFVWLVAELVAVATNGWIFPGEYIGWVELFGLGFPFEELFFWMLFYAATIVSYYELLIDDYR